MKKITCMLVLSFSMILFAQTPEKQSALYLESPEWAKLMYSQNPDVEKVDKLFRAYRQTAAFTKSYHTQYYKRWRKALDNYIGTDGYIDFDRKARVKRLLKTHKAKGVTRQKRIGQWSVIGPFQNFQEGGSVLSGGQTNIYSMGQCASSPQVMYSGTESGEIYKTLDSGENWFNVSYELATALSPDVVVANAGISAIAVHPTNPDIVYAGSGSEVFKTIDGGVTWTVAFDSNIPLTGYIENPAEIFINPNNPNIVLVGGKEGLYRTSNAGTTWNQVLNFENFDIKAQPGNPNRLYTVRRNTVTNTHQFLISTNGGLTWTAQNNGWYNSTNPSRSVVGARIAVSNADPLRVYAYLIGDSKPGDNGFIGLYRSNDGGVTWLNTMGYDGAPYTDPGHPNLISSSPATNEFSFNQGFYNCAIMASNTNADEILVGGIGMWRSSDGGQSFNCVYNYGCGDFDPMHVDMQDFRAFGNEYWASTDGGIFKSADLFASQPEFKMKGIHGTDFWGFDSGWNHDLMVGGTFHNGVDVYYEGFPAGDFLDIGGGEPASGYVNPGNALRVYSEDIGSVIIPNSITGAVIDAASGLLPNEEVFFGESSEMAFHPSCYNHVYIGKGNTLYKSTDGGVNYNALYASASASALILGIETSRTNPSTMYIVERDAPNATVLIKTTDDWATTSTITLPFNSDDTMVTIFSLDPENDDIIWLAYPRATDGNKVYRSMNGGVSWTNETSNALDAQNVQDLVAIGGTNGGVYIATGVTVYYRDNANPAWILDNTNLPTTIATKALRPFYRDGKIRLASYGKGIWESPLYNAPTRPIAKIMVDKLESTCIGEIFFFDDYSMLNHEGASWSWTFEDANIATSSLRNPQVIFNSVGAHTVTLTITNAAGLSATDTLTVETQGLTNSSLEADFETEFIPEGWVLATTGDFNWTYNNTVGGFGQSTNCMVVNNFVISEEGETCDLTAPISFINLTAENAVLTFDVAYALYDLANADGLEVLISADCGVSFTSVYNKVGNDLATAPQTGDQFVPTNAQWRTETINLSTYIGQNSLYVKFRNTNAFGQALYIDNINLGDTSLSVQDFQLDNLSIFPNPVKVDGAITIKSPNNERLNIKMYDLLGKLVLKQEVSTNTAIQIGHLNLSTGLYLYEIVSETKIKKGKLLVGTER